MHRREMFEALGAPGDVRDWLTRRLTPSEISEARSDCAAIKPKPGSPGTWWDEQATVFAAHLGSLKDGDEVWEFRSPSDTWRTLRVGGRAGRCVVRDNNVIAVYITTLS
jgi:hypothetical protein